MIFQCILSMLKLKDSIIYLFGCDFFMHECYYENLLNKVITCDNAEFDPEEGCHLCKVSICPHDVAIGLDRYNM